MTVCQLSIVNFVRELKRGIKRDATQFSILKDDSNWDNWICSTTAQARAQDIADVLDPSFTPSNPDDIALFMEKQKFMYAVFEKSLQTNKGIAPVCHFQQTFDAQVFYKELFAYAMQSTKATMNASSILSYISTTMLGDGKWSSTTHAFILHWQDQVRKYHDLSPQTILSYDLQCTLLQNVVHSIIELRQVKLQAGQFKTHTGKDLSYNEYCTFLLSAAQQYDTQIGHSGHKIIKRKIFEHDLYLQHHDSDEQDNQYDESIDIDIPIADMQIHTTHFLKDQDYSMINRKHSQMMQGRFGTC